MGYKLALSDDETVATVRMPGLSIEDFDRDGNPKITSLLHIVSSMNCFVQDKALDSSGRTFYGYEKLLRAAVIFMASTELEIHEAMYDGAVPKWPLDYKMKLNDVGNSSIGTTGELTVASTGQTLFRTGYRFVHVNPITRRSMPLPDWWREKHCNDVIAKEPLIVQRTPRPGDTHVFKVRVMWTDTDNNNHATWTSYVQFSINAMHDGIRKNFYKNVNEEVVRRGLRKIRMRFMRESLEGVELIVHSWGSAEDDTTVCCEIENADGKVVFHTTLGYPSCVAKM
ncbi:uncharacterized protein LOC121380250 [Gigantopelta aegis]|uniref:uncharacterized protein LOC121380250 n=1 Tax=Gigantopelta aegis TaxID=1735272 RepID=UPI001B8888DE|nr:uncharacterized protein LOC121380250 [Gigantopelta aegis]